MKFFSLLCAALALSFFASGVRADTLAQQFCNEYSLNAGSLEQMHQDGTSDADLMAMGQRSSAIFSRFSPLPPEYSSPGPDLAQEAIDSPIESDRNGKEMAIIATTTAAAIDCMQKMSDWLSGNGN